MALLECPECKKEVSDQAPTCPSCGHPINLKMLKGPQQTIIGRILSTSALMIGLFAPLLVLIFGVFIGGITAGAALALAITAKILAAKIGARSGAATGGIVFSIITATIIPAIVFLLPSLSNGLLNFGLEELGEVNLGWVYSGGNFDEDGDPVISMDNVKDFDHINDIMNALRPLVFTAQSFDEMPDTITVIWNCGSDGSIIITPSDYDIGFNYRIAESVAATVEGAYIIIEMDRENDYNEVYSSSGITDENFLLNLENMSFKPSNS